MVRRGGSLRNWTCGGLQKREENAHAVVMVVVVEVYVTMTTTMTIHQTLPGNTIVTTIDHQIEYYCCDTTITATVLLPLLQLLRTELAVHLGRNVEG